MYSCVRIVAPIQNYIDSYSLKNFEMRNVKVWFLCFFKASSSVFKLSTCSKKELFMLSFFVHPPKISPHSHSGTSPLSFVTGARPVSIPCPLFSALIQFFRNNKSALQAKCQRFFHNCIQCQQKTQTPYSHCMIIVTVCIGMLTEIWVFPRQQELA